MFLGFLSEDTAGLPTASTRLGSHPQVVCKMLAKRDLLARHFESSRPVGGDGHDRDASAGHQAAPLEEQHYIQVQLQVLGEPFETHAVTGSHLLKRTEAFLIHWIA